MRAWANTADADQLVAVMALSNAGLSGGRLELVSYSEIRLRELLAEAHAHVNGPSAE